MQLKIKYYIVFLVTVLLSLLVFGTLFFIKAKADIERNILFGFEKTAQMQADQIEQMFKNFKTDLLIAGDYTSVKKALINISTNPDFVNNPKNKGLIEILNSRLSAFSEAKGLSDLILFNMEGRIVYTVSSEFHKPEICGIDRIIGKKEFEEAVQDGICISEVFKCRNREMILLLSPVYSKNKTDILGYIAFEINMSMISGVLQHTKEMGLTSRTYLAKSNGERVLYISDSFNLPAKESISDILNSDGGRALMKQSFKEKSSSWFGCDVKSNRIFAVWRNMPDLKLSLVSKIDTNEALFPMHQILKFIFMIVLGIFFILSVCYFALIRRITKPILKLHEAVKYIENGDMDYRINLHRKDELGQLANSFDGMVATLKKNTTSIENLNAQIHSREEAEKRLQKKTDEFEAYFSNAMDLFCIADAEGRIIRVNKQWEHFLGYADDELKGKKYIDFVHPDDLKFTKIAGTNLSPEKSIASFINRCQAKSGSYRYFEWRINLCNELLYISARDITKRKKAERMLRESEERFRTLIKLSPIPIVLIDSNGDFLYANDGFIKLLGYTSFDIPNIETWWLLAYPDENYRNELRMTWDKSIESARKDGTDIITKEVKVRCKEGQVKIVEISSIMFDDQILVTFIDNTERHSAQEKVETLLKEKEILLKEVHHRIKNHMSNISGLLMLQSQSLKGEAAKALEDAQSRLYSMSILYDRLYCSSNFNQISLKPYLEDLSRSILMTLQGSENIKISMNVEDILISAKISFALGIIVNELLTNIVKHAFVGRDKGEIKIDSFVKENSFTLIVFDNGVGISGDTEISSSNSFGVTLVRMMAAQINGKIELESVSGTKVTLTAPYIRE